MECNIFMDHRKCIAKDKHRANFCRFRKRKVRRSLSGNPSSLNSWISFLSRKITRIPRVSLGVMENLQIFLVLKISPRWNFCRWSLIRWSFIFLSLYSTNYFLERVSLIVNRILPSLLKKLHTIDIYKKNIYLYINLVRINIAHRKCTLLDIYCEEFESIHLGSPKYGHTNSIHNLSLSLFPFPEKSRKDLLSWNFHETSPSKNDHYYL